MLQSLLSPHDPGLKMLLHRDSCHRRPRLSVSRSAGTMSRTAPAPFRNVLDAPQSLASKGARRRSTHRDARLPLDPDRWPRRFRDHGSCQRCSEGSGPRGAFLAIVPASQRSGRTAAAGAGPQLAKGEPGGCGSHYAPSFCSCNPPACRARMPMGGSNRAEYGLCGTNREPAAAAIGIETPPIVVISVHELRVLTGSAESPS